MVVRMLPRPIGAEDEKIAEWEKRLGTAEPPPHMTVEHAQLFRECGYVGCWLEERLVERGANEQTIKDTCGASGQICYGRDPWLVARIMLEDFENGVRYQPGRELAHALLQGSLNEHFGPGGEGRSRNELMKQLGIHSMQELLDRFGVKTPEELKAKLEAKMAEFETR